MGTVCAAAPENTHHPTARPAAFVYPNSITAFRFLYLVKLCRFLLPHTHLGSSCMSRGLWCHRESGHRKLYAPVLLILWDGQFSHLSGLGGKMKLLDISRAIKSLKA